ncbi:MAG: DUF72 domain-containing protein [Croceibacterium sp.]
MGNPAIRVGTAGWSLPREIAEGFPAGRSALGRYAARFSGVEVNSSFHRPHRAVTWQGWGASVPAGFRFSAKLPKTITHQLRLVDCGAELDRFMSEVGGLGDKLAVLLVQLPPKLEFEAGGAAAFFADLAARTTTAIACEPRHPSWFARPAEALLAGLRVARVAADPARCEGSGEPGGWRGLSYWRLHGSPVMYRSSYADRVAHYARELAGEAAAGHDTWCMFDNTASSAAAGDALALAAALGA